MTIRRLVNATSMLGISIAVLQTMMSLNFGIKVRLALKSARVVIASLPLNSLIIPILIVSLGLGSWRNTANLPSSADSCGLALSALPLLPVTKEVAATVQ